MEFFLIYCFNKFDDELYIIFTPRPDLMPDSDQTFFCESVSWRQTCEKPQFNGVATFGEAQENSSNVSYRSL